MGIIDDLIQRGVKDADGWPLSEERIKKAVHDYLNGAKMAHAIARGGYRIDLDGKPDGIIEGGHQRAAQERIIRMGWQNHDGEEEKAA